MEFETLRKDPKYAIFFKDSEQINKRCVEYVLGNAKQGDAQSVCQTIDEFCSKDTSNWMMNLGNDKGALVDEVITQKSPQTILELGTYIGYSSIRFSRLLPEGGRLVTIDVNPVTTEQARTLAQFAGVTCIEYLLGGL